MARKPKSEPRQAVDAHGRITVPLGGADYILRPDHQALAMIELELGRSLMQLAGQATAGVLTMNDMGIICSELMKAHARSDPAAGPSYAGAKPENLAKLIMEAGAPSITARLAVLLVGAVTGGYTAQGEPKPAT